MLKVVCNLKNTTIILVFTLLLSIPFALSMKRDTSALSGGTIDTDVRVHPSLTLNLTSGGTVLSDINLELDPASNPFDYQDVNVAVGTNNSAGYVLTMSAPSSDLVNVADSTKTIPTLSSTCASGCTETDFPANHWGYKKDTGNYIPFDATGTTPLLSNATRTNNDSTTLRFAAKVDYTNPSGRYEQDLVFTITANMATYYMQDLDPAICSTDPIEAIDSRDGNTYWVAELADGNCWMLNNLQLGNDPSTTSIALTPANTNISQNYTLDNKLPSPGIMPYKTPLITDDVSGNQGYIYDNNAFYCTPDGINNYKSCYYNWYTATAGSGTSNVTGKDTNGVDVNESICPRGWVLPNGSITADNNFHKLYDSYGQSAARMLVSPIDAKDNINGSAKPGFLLSGGYYYDGAMGSIGTGGRYWSRTAYSTTGGLILLIDSTTYNTASSVNKYHGFPVRCLRETRKIGDIQNMQDISPAIVANTNKESSTTLKDTRDNQEYTVAKLKDSKVWMTQNLRLGTGTNSISLTPMNSNVATNTTITYTQTPNFPYNSNSDPTYDGWAYYCTPDSTNYYVGCYYNWYTATASTGKKATPAAENDATASICPKGWFLPKGGSTTSTNDFYNIYQQYPSASEMLVSDPTTTYNNTSGLPQLGLLLSGVYRNGGPDYVSQGGGYWLRSVYSDSAAYVLNLSSSAVNIQDSSPKYYGRSVRCLAY